jgi:peptidoglycan/LPS O-acetylase OafA/YrhL
MPRRPLTVPPTSASNKSNYSDSIVSCEQRRLIMAARETFWTLEGLRFLASIAIMIFHFLPYTYPDAIAAVLWITKLPIAVDLYFVISGIVITNRYAGKIETLADYFEYIKRRVARLYPLHLATLGFYVIVGLAASLGLIRVVSMAKYNFSDLIPNLLMVHAWGFSSQISFNYVSWAISALFFCYLLFPVVLAVVVRSVGWGLIAVIFALCCAAIFSERILERPLTSLTFDYAILRAIPSFAFGVWLCSHRRTFLCWVDVGRTAVAFHLSLALLIALLFTNVNIYVLLCAAYLVAFLGLLCDVAGGHTLLSWAPISGLGVLTYSVYMLHTLLATVLLSFVFPRLFGNSFGVMAAGVAVAAVGTLFLSIVSYKYFEEPVRRKFNAWDPRLLGGRAPSDSV